MTSSGLRSIARNTGQMTSARIIGPLVQAGYVFVIASYLGPELFGLLSYSRSWYLALLPLAVFGLGPILSREIGADRGRAPEIIARTLALRILTTLFAALVCVAIAYQVETDPTVLTLIGIFSLALAARSLSILAEQVFVAFESAGYMVRQEVLFRPFEAGIGSTIVLLGGGVLGVALVHAAIWCLQACRGLYLVRARFVPLRLDWSWGPLATLLRHGFMIGLAGFCTLWLLNGQLVLYRHAGASEYALGQFALAIQLLSLAVALPMSVGTAAMPVLSRSIARGDRKDSLFVDTMCRVVLFLGTVVAISGSASGPWFAETIFGSEFTAAGELLGPVLWLLVPFTIGQAAQTVLFAKNQLRTTALCAGAGALVLTASMIPLASSFDAIGAVLAAGLGMITWASASLAAIARLQGLVLSRTVVRPFGAVACAVAAYWLLMTFDSWLAWLGSMVTLFGASIILGVLSPMERSAVLDALRQRRSCAAEKPTDLPPAGTSS